LSRVSSPISSLMPAAGFWARFSSVAIRVLE
jgi:hypothetical protein